MALDGFAKYKAIILDMDGTLYFQLPVRIFMAFDLLIHYCAHIMNIKELFALKEFRKIRENGVIQNKFFFTSKQYDIVARRFQMEPDAVRMLVKYWMFERPLKYIYRFRDKKLLELIQLLHNKGIKIIVYSDYHAEEKIEALESLKVDYIFCASDPEIMCLKPDIKGLVRIVEIIDEPIERILFIGDRYEKDGLCAAGVGVDFLICKKSRFSRARQLNNMKHSVETHLRRI